MAAASGGGMTAVMNTPADRLLEVLGADGVEGVEVAAHNTDTQVVIAADGALRAAHASLRARGIRFAPLRVGAAFHSRAMESARTAFEVFLRQFTFAEPSVTVISNASARPYEGSMISEMLCRQIVEPVRWVESVRHLLDRDASLECEEIGGASLLRMVKSIAKSGPRGTLTKSGV